MLENTPSDIGALASQAAVEPKPGEIDAVGPDVQPGNGLITLGFTPEFIGEMWQKVEKGTELVKAQSESWKNLLSAYIPKVTANGVAEDVNTNGHFRNVHTKLGQLFLQTPEVCIAEQAMGPTDMVKPSPINPTIMIALSDIIAVKQIVLNKRLGRDGIKADRLIDELLFDVMAWSGVGCSKLGHTIVMQDIQQPVMEPVPMLPSPPMGGMPPTGTGTPPLNPSPVPGSAAPAPPLPTGPGQMAPAPPPPMGPGQMAPPVAPQMRPKMDMITGQPVTQTVTVPIYEESYWRRFSPLKWVPDPDCRSTRYDEDAMMQGMWFSMLPHQAVGAFQLTDADLPKGEKDDKAFDHKDQSSAVSDVVMGVEVFIKASAVDSAIAYPNQPGKVQHPQKLLQLVLLKHIKDRPVVWRECVDQTFDEKGELTQDSIDRNPIRILTIRDLADSGMPQADSAFTNPLVKTRNTSLRQQIQFRNAAIPKSFVNSGAFEPGDLALLKSGAPGAMIEVAGDALLQGADKLIVPVPIPTISPDSYRLDAELSSLMDQTLGIDANTAGSTNDTVRAATEIAVVQQAVAGRNEKERARVIGFYLDGVRLIDIFISRYTTQTEWVRLTGPVGAAKIQAWNGDMVSGRWMYDIMPDSQFRVDTAQDRQQTMSLYNLTAKDPLVNRQVILQRLARQFGFDPSKLILPPQPPMPGLPPMQPPHGGVVNEHQASNSGGRPNAPGSTNLREAQQQTHPPQQPSQPQAQPPGTQNQPPPQQQ